MTRTPPAPDPAQVALKVGLYVAKQVGAKYDIDPDDLTGAVYVTITRNLDKFDPSKGPLEPFLAKFARREAHREANRLSKHRRKVANATSAGLTPVAMVNIMDAQQAQRGEHRRIDESRRR